MDNQTQQPVAEGQITPQTLQQTAPDVASPQGQQKLFQKAVAANVAKKQLDGVLDAIAKHIGATTSSRVKNIETASKKIAQKRLTGRDYGIDDINDMLGGRIVVKNKRDIEKAQKSIGLLEKAGVFQITKQQKVIQGTYEAYHFDVTMNNGTKAEVQIHTPQSEAEAVSNHSLRSQYGEEPANQAVEQLRNKQAQIARSLPNQKAQAVSQALTQLSQQQGGQIAPTQSAQLLAQANQ